MNIKLGQYKHFKGNEYEVIGIAKHSENLEPMVIYRALYGEKDLWVRPASMWNEIVDKNGYKGPRFIYIDYCGSGPSIFTVLLHYGIYMSIFQ